MPDTRADRVHALYRIRGGPGEARALARSIAIEQTVEVPEALLPPGSAPANLVGRVESVEADRETAGASRAAISYPAELASDLFGLLNVAFGNASMLRGVRLVDLTPPDSLLEALGGPNHGVIGIRRQRGVLGRPLLATAVKPRGLPVPELAAIAEAFARGGGDLIKDDQNLTDDFEAFRDRVSACAEAVDRGNQASGGRTLYLPHAGAPADRIERYVEFVAEAGLPGVLVCPMLVGLDAMRSLSARYPLIFMAHPSLSGPFTHEGSGGMDAGVLLGTLFRLAGADISVFPDRGGRFRYPESACSSITRKLRRPLGALARAWPAPAGGMSLPEVPAVAQRYGADSVLLIGGALLTHPAGVETGTRELVEAIRAEFPEVAVDPEQQARAEIPEPRRLTFLGEGRWKGRSSSPYKDGRDLSFRGVRRVELVGRFGERTRCDLRYFEVEPGGYTSLERHVHTHVVIGARGEGVLRLGDRELPFGPLDVATVGPLEEHQLSNRTGGPFGFFCIVDHERDRAIRAPGPRSGADAEREELAAVSD